MRRVVMVVLTVVMLTAATACASRPPIDVYGHKDSVYKYLIVGVPI